MISTEQQNETYTSAYNPEINVVLTRGDPCTYVNFTSGYPQGCDMEPCPGKFVVIFGAFVNGTDPQTENLYLNTVDCLLTYGSLNITQDGTKAPVIVSGSYQQNTSSRQPSPIVPIRRIYRENADKSPYYFNAKSIAGDTSDTLYNSALGTLLLKPKAASSADQVAQRMQNIFNTATLVAFVRSPGAADVTITTTTTDPVYVFHPLVLLILLVPALALVLGTYMRWRVESNAICPEYDPVEIARRGPVLGMGPWDGNQVANSDDGVDKKRVTLNRVEEDGEHDGDKTKYQLEVF
ncbi:uncharacterized protein TRIVIDRAFT_232672 [Trichoderma virens Gv29-8]|uniref:Uncharacterized protein n=1 Tax=Hypocrea virens (strain Gv29-8 / FGSC 10586) TaxID=413071 RepID=G9ND26_HYPVG|nr:uncharacterized protein TRIVIDRAFT_232672 [Trichoderma virens Gv29-8]EHK15595.1 hypothetical protein TRIVIDRAFT_232672 [Trichoderma virens Gv29-8]UKZ51539.1 hypothetical protein TrVGV298_005299 [Trichoderma virens]